jgi:phosphatidylglycerophosphate synthase
MNSVYLDQSRDRRIEDPTNLWVVHPAARALLPWAIRSGIPANAVSIAGLSLGALAATCYSAWPDWRLETVAFLLCIGWLIADGLDGMVARATGSASALGRILDGLCDHGVFGLLYISMALSIGTIEAWAVGWAAAAVHAVQSSLYEGERARYHRRLRGDPLPPPPLPSRNPLVRAYEAVSGSLDRAAASFDAQLAARGDPARLIDRYREKARRPMKMLSLLSSNVRVIAMYLAYRAGDPMLFWWFVIIPLSAVALVGILWHRAAERLSVRLSGV